ANAGMVAGCEQLVGIADVPPLSDEAVAVDRRTRYEPGDEAAGLVGRVSLLEIAVDERNMVAVKEIGGGCDERRLGMLRLLDETDEPVVVVQLDGAVLLDELEVADVVERDGARFAFAAPPAHVLGEAEVEQVVAGD